MRGFTDIHHHLLFGIDGDGPQTKMATVRMLEAARGDGIDTIIATPHVTPGIYAFDMDDYLRRYERVSALAEATGGGLTILPGAELFYTEATCRLLEEGRVPTLSGSEHVLVEFSPGVRYDVMRDALWGLSRHGYVPIVAHVERYACLVHHPQRARDLRGQRDVRFQVNCATILHRKGFLLNQFLTRMLEGDLIDALATDAHNTKSRRVCMAAAYRALSRQYGARYAAKLTGRRRAGLFAELPVFEQ